METSPARVMCGFCEAMVAQSEVCACCKKPGCARHLHFKPLPKRRERAKLCSGCSPADYAAQLDTVTQVVAKGRQC